MSSSDDQAHQQKLLAIHRRNLTILEEQAAFYGGAFVPLHISNHIDSEREQIAAIEARLGIDSATSAAARLPDPQPHPDVGQPAAKSVSVALEFELGSDVQITWRSSLFGRVVTSFTPPYDQEELPLIIRALDALQGADHTFSTQEQEILAAERLWLNGRPAPEAYRVVGQALFRELGAPGQALLKQARDAAIHQGFDLNYVLRFPAETVSLAALPWEALWDQAKNQPVLLRSGSLDSCERYLDLDIALPPPIPRGRKVHVLALSPQYRISEQVRQEERAGRLETWDRLRANSVVTYDELSPLTIRAFNDYMRNAPQKPDIIHYYGHGIYRDRKGYLHFDDGRGGAQLVSAEQLASAFGKTRLVVLYACQSAMVDDYGLLTGIAPALSVHCGAVVAMQLSVRISAATRFAEVFYSEALGRKRSLQDAVTTARNNLFSEEPDSASWFVPTLYIRGLEQKPVYLLS